MVLEEQTGREIAYYTSIKDNNILFNLEGGNIDKKLNDEVGSIIDIKDVYLKSINNHNSVDKETGEVIDKKSRITILIDTDGNTHVTGSKFFFNRMIAWLKFFGTENLPIKIRIIKVHTNKTEGAMLSFEVLNG